jgi:hypothetical protein
MKEYRIIREFNLNNILLCIIHNRIRQQAISLYKPSPISYGNEMYKAFKTLLKE